MIGAGAAAKEDFARCLGAPLTLHHHGLPHKIPDSPDLIRKADRKSVPKAQSHAIRKPKEIEFRAPGDVVQIDTLTLTIAPGRTVKHFDAYDVFAKRTVAKPHARATAADFLQRVTAVSKSISIHFSFLLVLADHLGTFCERYPDLSIEFVTREQVGDLVSDGIDLAIRFGQSRLSSLVVRKLIEAPILTVASPGYLERFGRPTHPSDVAQHAVSSSLTGGGYRPPG